MKNYDYKKAKQLIAENADNLQRASLGMHEDWGWTADTVWEDGKYTKRLTKKTEIAGISGSAWATPTLELEFKDGSERMIPCYEGESDRGKPEWLTLGVITQPIQDNITPLETT